MRGRHGDAGGTLLVQTTTKRKRSWKEKAQASDMTLKAWVEKSLDDAPVYVIKVVAK